MNLGDGPETQALQELRCESCRKLLFKGLLVLCFIQIKCRRCGRLVTIHRLEKPQDSISYSSLLNSLKSIGTDVSNRPQKVDTESNDQVT